MSKKRVLVAETLEQAGIDLLRERFEVDVRERTDEETLAKIIGDYDALMIKTYTRVSKAVIDNARKLKIVARAGSGLDKVDLAYAKERASPSQHAAGQRGVRRGAGVRADAGRVAQARGR